MVQSLVLEDRGGREQLLSGSRCREGILGFWETPRGLEESASCVTESWVGLGDIGWQRPCLSSSFSRDFRLPHGLTEKWTMRKWAYDPAGGTWAILQTSPLSAGRQDLPLQKRQPLPVAEPQLLGWRCCVLVPAPGRRSLLSSWTALGNSIKTHLEIRKAFKPCPSPLGLS